MSSGLTNGNNKISQVSLTFSHDFRREKRFCFSFSSSTFSGCLLFGHFRRNCTAISLFWTWSAASHLDLNVAHAWYKTRRVRFSNHQTNHWIEDYLAPATWHFAGLPDHIQIEFHSESRQTFRVAIIDRCLAAAPRWFPIPHTIRK